MSIPGEASTVSRLSSPAAVLGFGGLLLLMTAMSLGVDHTVRRLETESARIRQEFLERDNLLDEIRLALYRSSADVREIFSNRDPQQATRRIRDLEDIWLAIDSAIGRYQAKLGPDQSTLLTELRLSLAEYRRTLPQHLPPQPVHGLQRPCLGGLYEDRMLPRYQQLLRLADQLGAVNSLEANAKENEVTSVFVGFRRRMLTGGMLGILLGGLLAVGTVRRIRHLELRAVSRYQEVVSARAELQQLSARLLEAQEEERRRLSRELHDEVGQSMTAISVELGNIEASFPITDEQARSRLKAAKRQAEAMVHSIRNMALLLRPSMLDDLGLVPALRWQAREMMRRTGISVKVAAENVSESLPESHRTCIYRVVQESLHNASRHSRATEVRVTVAQEAAHIRFSIQDNGVGFNPLEEKGMGLVGMKERVHRIGGVLQVDSEPQEGTVVSVLLPLPLPGGAHGED